MPPWLVRLVGSRPARRLIAPLQQPVIAPAAFLLVLGYLMADEEASVGRFDSVAVRAVAGGRQ
jgi:hypothetical protein